MISWNVSLLADESDTALPLSILEKPLIIQPLSLTEYAHIMLDRLISFIVVSLLRLTALLPLTVSRALGRTLARIVAPIASRSRRVTELNIRSAYPHLSEPEQRLLARQSLAATGELMTEMGYVWMRPYQHLQKVIVSVTGSDQVSAAVASGRGVIVLAPHIGNWEVLGLHLGTLGETVSLYEPPAIKGLGKVVERARQRSGATLVPTDSRGLATLLRSVKRGKISGILPDQVPPTGKAGRNVPFMGIPCYTGSLAVQMIQRTGALAVFGFAKRVPGGFEVIYLKADEALYSEDLDTALTALNAGVERCVSYCPAQYQWEYKRFKTRPPKEPEFYAKLKGI